MKILVTGGNGFVGIHMLRLLSRRSHPILATWFHKPPTQEERALSRKIRWTHCNLTRPQSVARLIRREKPYFIFHLAAMASVAQSWKNPQATYAVNVLGTLHLVEALAQSKRPCTLVVVESGEVYGRASFSRGKITEETPLRPENPYAASKACQDLLLYPYFHLPHLKIIRLRPLNHIGPGQSPDYVVSSFASQIAAIEAGRRPAILHVGNLRAKRDFTDVRDVVKAYLQIALKGKRGEVYNVASGHATSINVILLKLLKLSRVPIRVQVDPSRFRPNDIPVLYAPSAKLKRATGWSPKISLDKSLKDTLDDWRKKFA